MFVCLLTAALFHIQLCSNFRLFIYLYIITVHTFSLHKLSLYLLRHTNQEKNKFRAKIRIFILDLFILGQNINTILQLLSALHIFYMGQIPAFCLLLSPNFYGITCNN